jgi:hypothetical protein
MKELSSAVFCVALGTARTLAGFKGFNWLAGCWKASSGAVNLQIFLLSGSSVPHGGHTADSGLSLKSITGAYENWFVLPL